MWFPYRSNGMTGFPLFCTTERTRLLDFRSSLPWPHVSLLFRSDSVPASRKSDATSNSIKMVIYLARLGMTYFPPFVHHFTESCWLMVDLHLRPSGHLLASRLSPYLVTRTIDNATRKTNIARQMTLMFAPRFSCGACQQSDARMDCSVSQASGDNGRHVIQCD